VIEGRDGRVTQFREKPILSQMVSMGVYCMDPQVLDYIPSGVPFGFDDLMLCVMERGIPVHTFEHNGLWLDVGRVQDFQQAQELNWDDQPPAFQIVAAA
jgi:mannose-1-phosphate guanylyltransferase